MTRRSRLATRPRLESLDERLLLSALTPAQVNSAYGLNAIAFSGGSIKGNGLGQTIAISDAYNDPNIYSDLVAFDAKNSLPNPYLTPSLPAGGLSKTGVPAFSIVNFAGATTNANWSIEEALDVELAHAAAPMANIVLVEAKTAGLYDLLASVSAIKTLPSVDVVSMSWGGPDFNGEQAYDSTFTTPAGHVGITFVASSGDNGAGSQWPASSPNVVSVGGSSLTVGTTGARASEAAWGGSGGGASPFETRPGYQSLVVSGRFRSVPDVAFDADPNTGVLIVQGDGQGALGGTSVSAPIFAGLIAIADEGLNIAGKPSLDGATQTLPDLYKAPTGSFFDIKTGDRATVGYDTSTGLGSPNAASLITFLDGASSSTTTTGVVGSPTTGTKSLTLAGPAFAVPLPEPTSPNLAPVVSLASQSVIVPNLVTIPLPIASMDSSATDAALSSWNSTGRRHS